MTERGDITVEPIQSRAMKKLERSRRLPLLTGITSGVLTTAATWDWYPGAMAGLSVGGASYVARFFLYCRREARYAHEPSFDVRNTPQGEQTIAELRQLHARMYAVMRGEQSISPANYRQLLPYATVMGFPVVWLDSPARTQAFDQQPDWLKPLYPQIERPVQSLKKFINFCWVAALESDAHEIAARRSRHREASWSVITQSLFGIADGISR